MSDTGILRFGMSDTGLSDTVWAARSRPGERQNRSKGRGYGAGERRGRGREQEQEEKE